ncbi:MAG: InlB B-repeat-containing protein [Aeriscardovia sp.]|nr:InlB B-repeat-containing protein [Aeriscardovia sp.]
MALVCLVFAAAGSPVRAYASESETAGTDISSLGSAVILSITDGSGNAFTGINTEGETVGTENPNGDQSDSLSLRITFDSGDTFKPGEKIVVPITNGAHQPFYQSSITAPSYVSLPDGTHLFSATSRLEGDAATDTEYPELILTALPAIASMSDVTTVTVKCAGSLTRANVRSDLVSSTKSTFTTTGNTYTITNKAFDLTACFSNNLNKVFMKTEQSLGGGASMSIGYDARCIINQALKTGDKNPVAHASLSEPIIVWQHLAGSSPFTINHAASTTGIQGVVNWVSSQAGYISGKQAYSETNTSYQSGSGIASFSAAQSTLEGHVGETIVQADGSGGYYVASNIGAPGDQPSNDLDTMEPYASNNTGMSSIVSELKGMGLDYPSRWTQRVFVQFTDDPDISQSVSDQWEIGPATADSSSSAYNGSIINPAMSGTATLTSQNVLGQTNGKQYAALHYDANGGNGTMGDIVVIAGSSVSLEQNGFTRPGYTFTGWNTEADGSGTSYQPGASITLKSGVTVVYAQWEKNPEEQVIYEGNGATSGSTPTQNQTEGLSVSLEQNGFTRPGYTFTGWNTEADGSGTSYQPNDSYTIPGHTTYLYAQWKRDEGTIVYNANGGSGTMASQSGGVGSSVSLEQNGFTRPGYTFTGWNTEADGSGTSYQPGASITIIDGTRTLYAQWVMSVNSLPMTGGRGSLAPIMVGFIVSCAAIAVAAAAAWRKRSEESE